MKTTTSRASKWNRAIVVSVPGHNEDDAATYHVISRNRAERHALDTRTFATAKEAARALRRAS
jgi:hypothetical protein